MTNYYYDTTRSTLWTELGGKPVESITSAECLGQNDVIWLHYTDLERKWGTPILKNDFGPYLWKQSKSSRNPLKVQVNVYTGGHQVGNDFKNGLKTEFKGLGAITYIYGIDDASLATYVNGNQVTQLFDKYTEELWALRCLFLLLCIREHDSVDITHEPIKTALINCRMFNSKDVWKPFESSSASVTHFLRQFGLENEEVSIRKIISGDTLSAPTLKRVVAELYERLRKPTQEP